MNVRIAATLENSSVDPDGKMPPSTAGGTPAATWGQRLDAPQNTHGVY